MNSTELRPRLSGEAVSVTEMLGPPDTVLNISDTSVNLRKGHGRALELAALSLCPEFFLNPFFPCRQESTLEYSCGPTWLQNKAWRPFLPEEIAELSLHPCSLMETNYWYCQWTQPIIPTNQRWIHSPASGTTWPQSIVSWLTLPGVLLSSHTCTQSSASRPTPPQSWAIWVEVSTQFKRMYTDLCSLQHYFH